MKNWLIPCDADEETRRKVQELARESMKMRLLDDIKKDILVCSLEGWDYKEYLAGEVTFGIGSIYTETEESLGELTKMIEADFPSIYASGSQDMLFCLVSTDEMTRMIWCGEGVEEAVQDSFPEYDGSGCMNFIPKASRKEDIVPPLTATLEKWSEEGHTVP